MRRLWSLLRHKQLEREIAEELATHAALLEDANRAHGTHRRLGSELALRERTRAADVPLWLDELLRDVGFARRSLWRARGFATVAILTLALGIGATTAMYSVVNTFVLRTLPYPSPSHLVRVEAANQHASTLGLFLPARAIRALRTANIFSSLGTDAVPPRSQQNVYLDGFTAPFVAYIASPGWFPTLGARFAIGRNFSGHAPEAIVSEHFFKKQMEGKRSALGRPLRVGTGFYSIVGVLAAGQQLPPLADVWINRPGSQEQGAEVIARLRSGLPLPVELSRARDAAAAVGAEARTDSGPYPFHGLVVLPMQPWRITGTASTAFWLLLAAAACLLLIACANTANLLLARGLDRQRELAVRRALGASRWRLLRLLLAEGLWLALLAGIVGAALAWAMVRLIRLGPIAMQQLSPLANLLRLDSVRLSAPALELAAVLALLSGLLCALAPALRFLRRRGGDLDPLHGGEQSTRRQSLRRFLVAGEMALTLALLTGGLLLARSFANLAGVTLGFSPEHVAVVRVAAQRQPAARSARSMMAQRAQAFASLQPRLQALPGIISVGFARSPLFVRLAERTVRGWRARRLAIGPGYFHTLEIPLLAGRGFTGADADALVHQPQSDHRTSAVVVNAALARELWPGRSTSQVIGARVQEPHVTYVVVGVAGDVNDEPGQLAPPTLYTPLHGGTGTDFFFVRSALPPNAVGDEIRAALPHASVRLTLSAPVALDDSVQRVLAWPRFRTAVMAAFAVLAWALALVGLYGVLAFQVRQRRREIGVRMALGADGAAVIRLVLGQSLTVLVAGVAAGWLLCWLLSRYIAALLFGVGALDPTSWLSAGAALIAAGLLASFIPARRALRVDAAETLRCE